MLPPSDRAISRSHCKINYKIFFDATPPEIWIAFLMGSHPRLGRNSFLQFLPIDLFRYIFLFIKQPRLPMLVDLGSMCGTYIKVSNFEPIVLEPGMVFLVGSDINIEFDKVVNDHNAFAFGPELTLEDGGCMSMNMVQDSEPFVIIKVSKASADNEATVQTSTWKFVAQDPNKVFTIGRSQVCDINLPENTISRTQCRVFYSNRSWKLLDGVENKPTVNGTWQSISRRNNAIRQESDPFPLKNGSHIKISDTIVQVDWN